MPDRTPLGLLIVAARQSLRQAICTRVRPLRLTNKQFWTVIVLRERPGLTSGELGHAVLLDAPAMSRLVAGFVRRKLVEVRPDREDRRRARLFLTAAGEALGSKLAPIADEFQAAVVSGLSEEQLEVLREGLRRVVQNLATFESGAPAAPGRIVRAS